MLLKTEDGANLYIYIYIYYRIINKKVEKRGLENRHIERLAIMISDYNDDNDNDDDNNDDSGAGDDNIYR